MSARTHGVEAAAGLEVDASRHRPTEAARAWEAHGRLTHSDRPLVLLALLHGAVLALHPSVLLIALGLWWNSNTIAHYFIHRPFFRDGRWNRLFSAWQSVVLGIPQRLWRDRHLAHHAEVPWRLEWSNQLLVEASLVLALWTTLAALRPEFFLRVYLPGYVLGLCLCSLQGHFEHMNGTTSHYGRFYNALFFNDGYHVEHHRHPAARWPDLPSRRDDRSRASRWPAVLRWIEAFNLETLERLVLRSKLLQRFVLSTHSRAFERLLDPKRDARLHTVAIVGGGLFPRTALILRKLLPHSTITIIEENPAHVAAARRWLSMDVECVVAHYDAGFARQFDAIVIPLALRGDRDTLCAPPLARTVFVHDWIWRRSPKSRVISWLLLKRLNRIDE